MYTPDHFKIHNESDIHDFIERFDFGLVVSPSLNATHIPLLLQRKENLHGTLYGHVARVNPHWKEMERAEVVAIFTGPHGFISPIWYQDKPAVPTWNYTSVHAFGKVSLLSDVETEETINATLGRYEPALLEDNEVLTDEHKHKLLTGIVGFKIEIDRLEGKAKLSQNRSNADRKGVIRHLVASGDPMSLALAEMMEQLGTHEG
jgi:transcriptional regulator